MMKAMRGELQHAAAAGRAGYWAHSLAGSPVLINASQDIYTMMIYGIQAGQARSALAVHHPLARATSSAFFTAKHVHCKPRRLKAPARDHTTPHLHFQRPSDRARNCAQSVTGSAAQKNSRAKHAGTRRVRGTCRWARRSMRCRRNCRCLQVDVRINFMSGEI